MAKKQPKRNPNIGKIGWCDSSVLGLSRGHYVYIRNQKNNKCDVNTFTSLEDRNGRYKIHKIDKVRDGIVYAIPKQELTLPKFSGIYKGEIKNINVNDIKYIGTYKLNSKHKNFIKKHMK